MESSITFTNIIALFGTMVVLALIPSTSVLTVTARSAASGFIHGAFTAMGIVIGDIIFILVAILGLTLIAETFGNLFILLKYLGAAYLVWLGIDLWKSKSMSSETEEVIKSSLLSSFLTGLFITLGDQKAILFYLGFFPAFIDLSTISYLDISLIIIITIVAVGGVKLGYAFMADKTSLIFSSKVNQGIKMVAGSVMIGTAILLVVNS